MRPPRMTSLAAKPLSGFYKRHEKSNGRTEVVQANCATTIFCKKCKVKEPVFFDELLLCGGERGIRTPVTVFAVNMISNFSQSLKPSIKSDFLSAMNSRFSCNFAQSVVKSVVSFFTF